MTFDVPDESHAEGSEFNKGAESADDSDGWCSSDDDEDNSEVSGECEPGEGGGECEAGEGGGEKYIPPQMRLKPVDKEKMARLQKQVQGLVNR